MHSNKTKPISRSELQAFVRNPKHFWAGRNGHIPRKRRSRRTRLPKAQSYFENFVHNYVVPNYPESVSVVERVRVFDQLYTTTIPFAIVNGGRADLVLFANSYRVTDSQLDGLAYQVAAAESYYRVDRVFVVLFSQFYTRTQELETEYLFHVQEYTGQIKKRLYYIKSSLKEALQVSQLDDPASLSSCSYPANCPCIDLCHPDLPEYSVYEMRGLDRESRDQLLDQDILRIEDIPKDFLQKESQKLQLEATLEKKSFIDSEEISKRLDSLEYPLYFIDYEAYGFPLPLYPGYWPFSKVTFQYALHTMKKDGSVESHNFLHLEDSDPTVPFVQALKQHISEKGTLVVWDRTFEQQVHNHLARLHPQELLFLLDLNQRMFDLQKIFRDYLYIDYRFKGSISLKKILPIFAPESNHAHIEIDSGLDAAKEWYGLVHGETPEDEREEIIQELINYCQMDSLGMVEIYKNLREL